MPKRSKKYAEAAKQVEERPYSLEEAIPLLKKVKYTKPKFDETVEMSVRLGGPVMARTHVHLERYLEFHRVLHAAANQLLHFIQLRLQHVEQ